jgi:antitoxin component YwqK of YwqJK toxin-antitoxin module
MGSKKLQMQALYKDSACKTQHGYTIYYHPNGIVTEVGKKANGEREGVYIKYHTNGMMWDSAFYYKNKPVGNRYMWHRNGYLSDSIAHINDSTDMQVGWFDDGSPSHAGYMVKNKKAGKWKYYHKNGKLSAEENFVNGKLETCTYYNEDGSLQPDSAAANTDAVLIKGGKEGWKKYFEKNLYWPPDYKLVNTNAVIVGVQFIVNEDGTISDIDTYLPFYPAFDKIALNAIRKSPAWKPAVKQNRKVAQGMRQPVTFQQGQK